MAVNVTSGVGFQQAFVLQQDAVLLERDLDVIGEQHQAQMVLDWTNAT